MGMAIDWVLWAILTILTILRLQNDIMHQADVGESGLSMSVMQWELP